MPTAPEQQARIDWSQEASFRPYQFTGQERDRYLAEAHRIEIENEEAL